MYLTTGFLFQNPLTSIEVDRITAPNRYYLSQTDLVNITENSGSYPVMHSQSYSSVNDASFACATKRNLSYCRPASIILATTNDMCRHPVLKLCPSTPTPSETDSLASTTCTNQRMSGLAASLDDTSEIVNQFFPFVADSSNSSKFNFNTADIGPNLDVSRKNRSTNSNAHSLLVPLTSNNNAGITITTKNHRQHRSLSEITDSSPHNKGHISPGTAMIAEDDTAAKTTIAPITVANRTKLTPSPTRSGVVATPASMQSQSDSLSSATTISTATTIIPKEMGEMCRRSSDSDLSVTPKGKHY